MIIFISSIYLYILFEYIFVIYFIESIFCCFFPGPREKRNKKISFFLTSHDFETKKILFSLVAIKRLFLRVICNFVPWQRRAQPWGTVCICPPESMPPLKFEIFCFCPCWKKLSGGGIWGTLQDTPVTFLF